MYSNLKMFNNSNWGDKKQNKKNNAHLSDGPQPEEHHVAWLASLKMVVVARLTAGSLPGVKFHLLTFVIIKAIKEHTDEVC